MICPKCIMGYMLMHSDPKFAYVGWRKCLSCSYCCKAIAAVEKEEEADDPETL